MATNVITQCDAQDEGEPSVFATPVHWPEQLRRGIWPRSNYVWILAIYLAILILRPWELLIPELSSFRIEQKVIIFMGGAAALAGGLKAPRTLTARSLTILLGTIWATSWFAYDKEAASLVVTEMLGMVLCYFFCVTLVRSPYQLVFIVCAYVVIVFAYLTKSQWEYFVHGAGEFRMGVMRLRGIDDSYGHPNEVAYTALYTVPFAHFLWLVRHQWCATWPTFWRRNFGYFLLANFAVCMLTILLTRSRAGAMGAVFFLLLLAARQRSFAKKVKTAVTILVVCAAGLLLLPSDMSQRIRSIWDADAGIKGANTSAESRWHGFLAGMEMLRDRPIIGVGIGCFKFYRRDHCSDKLQLSAHNLPGELLGELGIVGGIVFGYFLYAVVHTLVAARRQSAAMLSPEGEMFAQLLLACQDSLWMLGFGSLSLHTLQRYQWFLIAAFVALVFRFARQMQPQVCLPEQFPQT
jgi:O-antigen ligase